MRLTTRALLLTGSTLIASTLVALPTIAAEGMWTLDSLPREKLAQDYKFKPTPAWL